jgi:hypothetical protein
MTEEKKEQQYISGSQRAWSLMLQTCLKNLGTTAKKGVPTERIDVILFLRDICEEFGDNDWPDNLHIVDIIDKHLLRHVLNR